MLGCIQLSLGVGLFDVHGCLRVRPTSVVLTRRTRWRRERIAGNLLCGCAGRERRPSAHDITRGDEMAGDTPTIVLVHGAWADATGFDAEIRALRDRGFSVIGFGNPLRD